MSLTEQTHDKHQTKQPQRPTKQESPPLLLPLEVGGSPGGSCRWHRGRRRRRRRTRRRCQTRSRPLPPPGRRSDYNISLKYIFERVFVLIHSTSVSRRLFNAVLRLKWKVDIAWSNQLNSRKILLYDIDPGKGEILNCSTAELFSPWEVVPHDKGHWLKCVRVPGKQSWLIESCWTK